MIVANVTLAELESARARVSKQYGDNIIWNRAPEALNKRGDRWRLTIRCRSSKGLGHGVSRSALPFGGRPRRLPTACWHVHGNFFDALPACATILARGHAMRPQDSWKDYNVGSIVNPIFASESCDC